MRKILCFLLFIIIAASLIFFALCVSVAIDCFNAVETGTAVLCVFFSLFSMGAALLCGYGIRKLQKPKEIHIKDPVYEVPYTVVLDTEGQTLEHTMPHVMYTEPPQEVLAITDGEAEQANLETTEDEVTNDLIKAMNAIMTTGVALVTTIQRETKWGYSKAARTMDKLEALGFVGPFEGSKPRTILVTKKQWEEAKNTGALSDIPIEDHVVEHRPILPDVEMLRNYELMSVDLMEGADFETWCAKALIRRGFSMVTQTGKTGDHGVDITAIKNGIKYAIQCKRYSHPLGNTPVQEVYAGKNMYDCQIGVVMTNQTFTDGAIQLANKTGVLLWDRNYIVQIIRDMIVDQSKE